MNPVFTIFRKEVAGFFDSLVGYVFLGVFLIATGMFVWVFEYNVLETRVAELDILFFIGPYLFIFMVPAITMRAFSEEIGQGTIEFLVTKPVTDWQIILGKYLASVFLVLVTILPTFIYVISLYALGDPPGNLDLGATFGAYMGLFFLGSIFAGIGLFTSALVNNQFVAWVLGAFVCFFFFLGFGLLASLPNLDVASGDDLTAVGFTTFFTKLGIMEHYTSISRGVIDTRDALYFFSLVAFSLASTHYLLTRRR
ncbi:MAG: ABC transporter permease subunit [Bacteroidia bacterium]|nr:ABC transporter permease subunit [Bacteroidia bacterium]